MMRLISSALGAMKRAPAGPFAIAMNGGQPTPPPHIAAARPSSTIGGPSPAFSSRCGSKSFFMSRPRPSIT